MKTALQSILENFGMSNASIIASVGAKLQRLNAALVCA